MTIKAGDHLALDGAVVSAQYANDGGKRHYIYGGPLEDGGAQRDASDHSGKQLLVQVTIDVSGHQISSIITSDAARSLGLKEGVQVYALIKATEVMVAKP